MRRGMFAALAAVVSFVGAASSAQAAVLAYASTFTIKLQSGTDLAGINGATVTFNAAFNDGKAWALYPPSSRFVTASTSSITIGGATNATSNGTRTPTNGAAMLYTQGTDNLWVDATTSISFPTVTGLANGQSFLMGLDLNAVAAGNQPAVADPVKTTHFGTVMTNPAFSVFYTTNNASYVIDATKAVSGAASGGPTTPEPTALAVLGFASIAMLRRRSGR